MFYSFFQTLFLVHLRLGFWFPQTHLWGEIDLDKALLSNLSTLYFNNVRSQLIWVDLMMLAWNLGVYSSQGFKFDPPGAEFGRLSPYKTMF